jgi:hypothetical protein
LNSDFSRHFRFPRNFRENFRYFRKLFAKSENKFSRKFENENFIFNPIHAPCLGYVKFSLAECWAAGTPTGLPT